MSKREPYLSRFVLVISAAALLGSLNSLIIRPYLNAKRIAELHLTRASELLRRDEFDEAIAELNSALQADKQNQRAYTELVKAKVFKIAAKYDQLGTIQDPT